MLLLEGRPRTAGLEHTAVAASCLVPEGMVSRPVADILQLQVLVDRALAPVVDNPYRLLVVSVGMLDTAERKQRADQTYHRPLVPGGTARKVRNLRRVQMVPGSYYW